MAVSAISDSERPAESLAGGDVDICWIKEVKEKLFLY
jgi:hypothetical protein